MLINNTLVTIAAASLAYKIHRSADSSEAMIDDILKMQAVTEIIKELNALRMDDYMSSDYSSSVSSSMSFDDYDLFFDSFEPIQFHQVNYQLQ